MRRGCLHNQPIANRKSCKSQGFTLVEVLIALLVLSIASGAVMKAIHAQINITEQLWLQNITRWVEMNVLSEMQAGILPIEPSSQEGERKMLGRRLYWSSEIRETDNARVFQVKVSVRLKKEQRLNAKSVLGFILINPST